MGFWVSISSGRHGSSHPFCLESSLMRWIGWGQYWPEGHHDQSGYLSLMKAAHRLEKVARDSLEHMTMDGGNCWSHKPQSLLLETYLQQQVFKVKLESLENTCQEKQTKTHYLRLAINTALENCTLIYLLSSPKGHDPWLTCELDPGTWRPLISSLVHVCFTCHSYAKSSCRSTVLREQCVVETIWTYTWLSPFKAST